MQELKKTVVPSETIPSAPSRFNAGQLFAHKDRLARLCLGVSLVSLVCAGLTLLVLLSVLRQRDSLTVIDEDGNVRPGTQKSLAEARELQQHTAFAATTALLLRNSRDFDEPELLQTLLSKAALSRAAVLKSAEARHFDEFQLQQKPLISRIDIRQSAAGEFHARVSGEVSRYGVFRDKAFADAIPFALELVLRRNPDLARYRLQPLIVSDFTLNYETPRN